MTIDRVRETWNASTVLTAAELDQFDGSLVKCLDGVGGGAYVTEEPLTVGGRGIRDAAVLVETISETATTYTSPLIEVNRYRVVGGENIGGATPVYGLFDFTLADDADGVRKVIMIDYVAAGVNVVLRSPGDPPFSTLYADRIRRNVTIEVERWGDAWVVVRESLTGAATGAASYEQKTAWEDPNDATMAEITHFALATVGNTIIELPPAATSVVGDRRVILIDDALHSVFVREKGAGSAFFIYHGKHTSAISQTAGQRRVAIEAVFDGTTWVAFRAGASGGVDLSAGRRTYTVNSDDITVPTDTVDVVHVTKPMSGSSLTAGVTIVLDSSYLAEGQELLIYFDSYRVTRRDVNVFQIRDDNGHLMLRRSEGTTDSGEVVWGGSAVHVRLKVISSQWRVIQGLTKDDYNG